MDATWCRAVNVFLAILFVLALALAILVAARPAYGTTTQLDLEFTADESLFQGGGAGREWSGSFGSTVGIRYEVSAELGVVQSAVNGSLKIEHPDVVPFGVAPAIELQFLGEPGASHLTSNWDLGIDIDTFLVPCLAPTPFGCLHPHTIPLFNQGFELHPLEDFTAEMGSGAAASDIDNAAGVGPNIDLIIGELGAEVSLDIAQSIELANLELLGLLQFQNYATGAHGELPFLLDSPAARELDLGPLGPGQWDFTLLFRLSNEFHHHAEFQIRPTINYVVGEWPPPGSPLFTVNLADNRYALDFSNPSFVDAFSIRIVPEPATRLLMTLVLIAACGRRLRT